MTHRGPSGGTISYFGFVNSLDISYPIIMGKLVNLTSPKVNLPEKGQALSSLPSQPNSIRKGAMTSGTIALDLSCIECDADGCTKSPPTIQCSKCKMVYYCSEVCQKRHQSDHLHECRYASGLIQDGYSYEEPSDFEKRGRGMAAMLAGRRDFEGMLLQSEYFQLENNWDGAFEIYKSLYDQLPYRSPPDQRKVYMGISRCFYEMKRYNDAIAIGELPIEMNRHFDGVHKYVALSQKAKGDIEGARKTMMRAVLYETPWNSSNIEANKALLKTLYS